MVSLARQEADLPAVLPADAESVATSPLVLAMPRHLNSVRPFHDLADALGQMLRAEYAPEHFALAPLPQAGRGR